MGKYFGTDGFRGEAGVTLTADHAYRIGRFLGWYYAGEGGARAVIGRDTRRSCDMLEAALVAGLTASGADAHLLGVITTPGVSFVTASEGFDCGVMLSASHNPYGDNGIKLVGKRGEKIDDATVAAVERYLDEGAAELPFAVGERIGRVIDHTAGQERYAKRLIALSPCGFGGLRIGLDCANGCACEIAPAVFGALGAQVLAIHKSPNGVNINRNCGSLHTEALVELVRREGLDMGFAFDGDADRCIAVDERGEVVDGDRILYVLAQYLRRQGALTADTVVTTVMSNLGLGRALARAGLRAVQTAVGDRFVYEEMRKNGYSLGGEQSGHVILSRYAATGDGILTAVTVTAAVLAEGRPLSALAGAVQSFPQITESLRVADKHAAVTDAGVQAAVAAARERLGTEGRVLVRESGTEPVVRVMVEAESEALCRACVREIAAAILALG